MSEQKLTFEQALEKLESIVERLESGGISLDESIEAFEEGQKLVQFCLKKLQTAEKKVKKLSKDGEGNFTLNDF